MENHSPPPRRIAILREALRSGWLTLQQIDTHYAALWAGGHEHAYCHRLPVFCESPDCANAWVAMKGIVMSHEPIDRACELLDLIPLSRPDDKDDPYAFITLDGELLMFPGYVKAMHWLASQEERHDLAQAAPSPSNSRGSSLGSLRFSL